MGGVEGRGMMASEVESGQGELGKETGGAEGGTKGEECEALGDILSFFNCLSQFILKS